MGLAGHILPELDNPTFDVEHGKVTWTESGGDATPQFAIAQLLVARSGASPLHGTVTRFNWAVGGDYHAGELRIPHLPAAYDVYNITATDTVTPGASGLLQANSSADLFEANRCLLFFAG